MKYKTNIIQPEINDVFSVLSKERLQHTVSIFFLGLVFYYESSKIKTEVDNHLEVAREKIKSNKFDINLNFIYWWFLICFLHDIGYAYKKNQKLALFGIKENNKIESKVFEELREITEFVSSYIDLR